jgi:hypothetical protein
MDNNFSRLDAQDPCSAFAKFTPEEHQEYQTWLAQTMGDSQVVPELSSQTLANATQAVQEQIITEVYQNRLNADCD